MGHRSAAPIPQGQLFRGALNGRDLLVCITGTGPQRAAQGIAALLEAQPVAAVLVAGVAGGLSPDLKPGSLVLSSRVGLWRDTNAASLAEPSETVPCDTALLQQARQLLKEKGVPFFTGLAACTPGALSTQSQKERLFRDSGAQVVDMESFWIVRAARDRSIPCLNVRTVLDTSSQSLPRSVLAVIENSGAVRARHLADFALRAWEWPGLLRLARNSLKARRRLTWFVHEFVQRL